MTSLSIHAGVLYIVPLFDSVLMLSPGCSSEVTLLESNIPVAVSHIGLAHRYVKSTRRLQTSPAR